MSKKNSGELRKKGSASVVRRGGEHGDTLIEVLITLMVISLCGLSLMTAFSATISGSAQQRSLASNDTILRAVSEAAFSQIQQQQNPSPWYDPCADANLYNTKFATFLSGQSLTPTGYGVLLTTQDLQYSSGSWSLASVTPISGCATATMLPQLVTVTVTAPNGTSDSTQFVVDGRNGTSSSSLSSMVTITNVSPSTLGTGTLLQTVVITGTGFNSLAQVSFSNSGISKISAVISGSTSISVVVSVANNATAGTGSLTVTNPDGSLAIHAFTVASSPTVISASPVSIPVGASNLSLNIVGNNFVSPPTVNFSNPAITAGAITGLTSTSFNVSISVGSSAAIGSTSTITVTNPDGMSGTSSALLTIVSAPVITSPTTASPCQIKKSTSGTCIITGTGFVAGDTVTLSGGYTIMSYAYSSSTQITVNVTASSALKTTWDITVTDPSGASATVIGGFGVTP